jgi:ribosomal protein S18 acetylase RimI-like enzyme
MIAFVQDAPVGETASLRLTFAGQSIGEASWTLTGPPENGVVQVLHFAIDEPHRRQGHGGRMMKEVVTQAQRALVAKSSKLRRVWAAVEQKTQIHARAFLTQQGFHHVSTIENLLKRQDLLVYVKSYA